MKENSKKHKILIIDDEPGVTEFIKKGLVENNFLAEIAMDGYVGLKMALANKYDLIILDIGLPSIDGFEICTTLRGKEIHTPILMLTALGSIDDKLAGFKAGTDDYLVKPFEFAELLARIYAVLKRASGEKEGDNLVCFADLVIDMTKKTVMRRDKRIDLTSREFNLLVYFATNPGKVISREEIARNVWNINFDTGTNVIDVYINLLRNKVDKNYKPKLLHTIIGMGYVLREETL
jgi:two-component system, OmpR family, copper resistance phosphate regulon response regulator CusR